MEPKIAEGKKGADSTPPATPAIGRTAGCPPPTPVGTGVSGSPPPPTVTGSASGAADGPPAGHRPDAGNESSGEHETPWLRTAAWIWAARPFGAGPGVAFQLASSSNLSDFNSGCGDPLDGTIVSTGTNTQAQCVNLHDSWSSDKHWAIAGYAVGGVFAVTSTVLFLTSRPKSAGTEAAAFGHAFPDPRESLAGEHFDRLRFDREWAEQGR